MSIEINAVHDQCETIMDEQTEPTPNHLAFHCSKCGDSITLKVDIE